MRVSPDSKLGREFSGEREAPVVNVEERTVSKENLAPQWRQQHIRGRQKREKREKNARNAVWKAQHREQADFEYQFVDYLRTRQQRSIEAKKAVAEEQRRQRESKPIILKSNAKTKYEKGVDDSEIGKFTI